MNQISVIILLDKTVFNKSVVEPIFNFSIEHTCDFYYALIANNYEILKKYFGKETVYLLFDVKDMNHIPYDLLSSNIHFYGKDNESNDVDSLIFNVTGNKNSCLIINGISLGISKERLDRVTNLLHLNDDVLVLGLDTEDKIALVSFIKYSEELNLNKLKQQIDFFTYLKLTNVKEHQLYFFNWFLRPVNKNSFKQIYEFLSKKENEIYCSRGRYSNFTNLFIEYKELLT